MLTDFLSKINWIDVLMVIIVFRVIFVGLKNGIVAETFKLMGALFSAFILLHYFTDFAGIFPSRFHLSKAFVYSFSFIVLWALITFVFMLIREGLLLVFSVEAHRYVDKWGGGLFSAFRALIVCGLAFYLIVLTGLGTEQRMLKNSVSQRCLGPVAPSIYSIIYYGLVSKFFPEEKLNEEALSILGNLHKKKS